MRFTINLTTRTYLNRRLLNQVVVSVIVLLIILLSWNVVRISMNIGEQQRLSSDIASLDKSLNTRPGGVAEKDFARQQSRISFFNEVFRRKSSRWLNLLELVENATPDGIALSALTPGKKSGELKLDGRARSFALVRQYLERLEGASAFSDVLLLSHQEILIGENTRGVQFSISCQVQF